MTLKRQPSCNPVILDAEDLQHVDIELTLAAVTTISLILAFAMGIIAWRLMREERKRSDARIAGVLAELAAHSASTHRATPVPRARTAFEHVERPVSSGSEDPVRLGVLTETLDPHAHLSSVRPVDKPTRGLLLRRGPVADGRPTQDLPRRQRPHARRRSFVSVPVRSLLIIATAAVLVVAVVAPELLIRPDAPTNGTSGAPLPVELLSLGHTTQGNYLTIAGSVRNPQEGTTRARLSISATVLDGAGGVIGSGQTPLPVAVLQPGGETAFTISLPDSDAINRYRIGFLEDQASVPHIDRRQPDEQALSTDVPSGT